MRSYVSLILSLKRFQLERTRSTKPEFALGIETVRGAPLEAEEVKSKEQRRATAAEKGRTGKKKRKKAIEGAEENKKREEKDRAVISHAHCRPRTMVPITPAAEDSTIS